MILEGARRDLAGVLAHAARYLAEHGVESSHFEAEILVAHVLGTDRAGLRARRRPLEEAEVRAIRGLLERRAAGLPLQHLTGDQPFFGLRLRVRPGVFIPRPETEVLVERALECLETVAHPVVVDVGTGTGAVALAVKAQRQNARVIATDRSAEAVALARENAEALGLEVAVLQGDLLAPLPDDWRERVDLVVSNPPYVMEEEYPALPAEVRADPVEAVLGGTDVHARLAEEAPRWLRPGGWLAMEIGAGQGGDVAALLDGRYEGVEVLPDLAGLDRVVRGCLPTK